MLLNTGATRMWSIHNRVYLTETSGSSTDSLSNRPRWISSFITSMPCRGPIGHHRSVIMMNTGRYNLLTACTTPTHIERGRTGCATHKHLSWVVMVIGRCVVKGSESLLPSRLPSGASSSCITVLRVDIKVGTRRWTEVRVSGLRALSSPTVAHLRWLPVDLRPMEVLQVLVSELTFILEVTRTWFILMNVEESRSDCLCTRDVSRTRRLQLLGVWLIIIIMIIFIYISGKTCRNQGISIALSRFVMLSVIGWHPAIVLMMVMIVVLEQVARAKRSIHIVGTAIIVLTTTTRRWTVITIPMHKAATLLLLLRNVIWLFPISIDIRSSRTWPNNNLLRSSTLIRTARALEDQATGLLHVLLLLNFNLHQRVLMVFIEVTWTERHLWLTKYSLLLLSCAWSNLMVFDEEIPMLILPMPIIYFLLQALHGLLMIRPLTNGHQVTGIWHTVVARFPGTHAFSRLWDLVKVVLSHATPYIHRSHRVILLVYECKVFLWWLLFLRAIQVIIHASSSVCVLPFVQASWVAVIETWCIRLAVLFSGQIFGQVDGCAWFLYLDCITSCCGCRILVWLDDTIVACTDDHI